jgi:hypothetical protein
LCVHLRGELPQAQRIELAVYNLLGQKVATLHDGMVSAGTHRELWTPQGGTGLYFVTLKTASSTHSTKVIYLK